MPFSRQPHQGSSGNNRRSFGHGRGPNPPAARFPAKPHQTPSAPAAPLPPPRRKPLPEGLIEKLCYEKDVLKPKPDCRAVLIDHCILEDDFDIDEAEDAVDKALRERNLWNEPSLEEILYGNGADSATAPSVDSQVPEVGDLSA
jgi:hypothetical protein